MEEFAPQKWQSEPEKSMSLVRVGERRFLKFSSSGEPWQSMWVEVDGPIGSVAVLRWDKISQLGEVVLVENTSEEVEKLQNENLSLKEDLQDCNYLLDQALKQAQYYLGCVNDLDTEYEQGTVRRINLRNRSYSKEEQGESIDYKEIAPGDVIWWDERTWSYLFDEETFKCGWVDLDKNAAPWKIPPEDAVWLVHQSDLVKNVAQKPQGGSLLQSLQDRVSDLETKYNTLATTDMVHNLSLVVKKLESTFEQNQEYEEAQCWCCGGVRCLACVTSLETLDHVHVYDCPECCQIDVEKET